MQLTRKKVWIFILAIVGLYVYFTKYSDDKKSEIVAENETIQKQLSSDKVTISVNDQKVKALALQRDDALKVSLQMKKTIQELKEKNLLLNKKINSKPTNTLVVKPPNNQKIKELEQERNSAISVSLQIKKALDNLKKKNSLLDRKIGSLTNNTVKSTAIYTANINKNLEYKIEKLHRSIDNRDRTIDRFQHRINDHNEKIQSEIEKKEEAISIAVNMKNERKEIKLQARQLQKEIKKLQNDLDRLKDNASDLKQERDEAIEIAKNMKRENSDIEEKTKILQSEIKNLQKLTENKKDAIEKFNQKFQDTINDKDDEIKNLKDIISKSQK